MESKQIKLTDPCDVHTNIDAECGGDPKSFPCEVKKQYEADLLKWEERETEFKFERDAIVATDDARIDYLEAQLDFDQSVVNSLHTELKAIDDLLKQERADKNVWFNAYQERFRVFEAQLEQLKASLRSTIDLHQQVRIELYKEIEQLKWDKRAMIKEIQENLEPHQKTFSLINIISDKWWQSFKKKWSK